MSTLVKLKITTTAPVDRQSAGSGGSLVMCKYTPLCTSNNISLSFTLLVIVILCFFYVYLRHTANPIFSEQMIILGRLQTQPKICNDFICLEMCSLGVYISIVQFSIKYLLYSTNNKNSEIVFVNSERVE